MMPSPIKALLDANVLYANHLRNLLLQIAQNDLFEARWTHLIEQEWLRNMEPRIRTRIEAHTLPLIRTWFTEALVSGFDPDQPFGTTDGKDRHVASAAVAIAPSVLLTQNPKHFDFEALKALRVKVQTPDDFLSDLFDAKPDVLEAAAREAVANLTQSNPSWDDYLGTLAGRCGLRKFAQRLCSWTPEDDQEPRSP
jgi:hypothetical protein